MDRVQTYQSHVKEIAEWLETGASTAEILKEYTLKWNCSERTVFRTIAMAKSVLAGRLKDKYALVDAIRAEALADDIECNLLSEIEVEMALCHIITNDSIVTNKLRAITAWMKMKEKFQKKDEIKTGETERDGKIPLKYASEDELKTLKSI